MSDRNNRQMEINLKMGENLKTCKVEELDEVLSRFLYAEVRKTNGEEYEPDCLMYQSM